MEEMYGIKIETVDDETIRIKPQFNRLTMPYTTPIVAIRNKYQNKNIIIDCTDVYHIDSTGIGALVHMYSKLKEKGCYLELNNLSGQPKETLKITRLDKVFIQTYGPL